MKEDWDEMNEKTSQNLLRFIRPTRKHRKKSPDPLEHLPRPSSSNNSEPISSRPSPKQSGLVLRPQNIHPGGRGGG